MFSSSPSSSLADIVSVLNPLPVSSQSTVVCPRRAVSSSCGRPGIERSARQSETREEETFNNLAISFVLVVPNADSMRRINPGYFGDSEFMLDMGSDNSYRARPSRAKAALMREKVQLELDRFDSWLGRFLCPSDWILVTSRDSSNVNRFPTLNADLTALHKLN